MKLIYLIFLTFLSPSAQAFDESINFQPGFSLSTEASTLTDLIGSRGSQLCAPVSLTHGLQYLKSTPGYRHLASINEIDREQSNDSAQSRIRHFFGACGTDKNQGTHYHKAQECISSYLQQSGYGPAAFIVGPHAVQAPRGASLASVKHALTIKDIRSYVGQKAMVVMGVGWYDYDRSTHTYKRVGGHFFNVYGYDYDSAWGESHVTLKVVNSLQDYSKRPPSEMFDSVEMTAVSQAGTAITANTAFKLNGPGFQFTQTTMVEDLFVVPL